MWRTLMVGAAGLALTAACGAATEPAPWAASADRYFAAMDQAGDRSVSERMRRFYADDVRIDSWRNAGFSCEGTNECLRWVGGRFGATADETSIGDLYLDTEGAVREVRHAWPSGVARELAVMDLAPDGRIELEIQPRSLETVARTLGTAATSRYRAEALAHLEAWERAVPDAVGARYADRAVVIDGLLGVRLAGRAAIEAHVQESRLREDLRRWRPTHATAEDPTVYLHLSGVRAALDAEHRIFVVDDGDDGTGCLDRIVTALTIRAGLVEQERRYHAVDTVRDCFDPATLPIGWWTAADPPPPTADQRTGAVLVDGRQIEVHNGTPALEAFLRWGFEQVGALGLPLPQVALVGFDQDAHPTLCPPERDGSCSEGRHGLEIYVCGDETDICADGECRTYSPRWRHLLLHELAHAWMIQHLDATTAERFLHDHGLIGWDDRELPWPDRGVEQAAEILAWGWTDEPIPLYRLGSPPCDELTRGFSMLTGTAPRQTCELDAADRSASGP